jgi:ankyrin repeat protein
MNTDIFNPGVTGKHITSWLALVFFSMASFIIHADVNLKLVDMAKEQQWSAVHSLLNEKSTDVNARQADGATALAWAVYWDNLATVQLLLDAGADPNLGNDYGVTPLILAAENRSMPVIEALLEAGTNPNTPLWSGATPLMVVAKSGLRKGAQLLLQHGADVDVQEPVRGQSALMWAISAGHTDVASLLVENGADINVTTHMLKADFDFQPMLMQGYTSDVNGTSQGGYTPLLFAALNGDIATARLLLDNGADINHVSESDGSALVVASANGNEELALFLLDRGADPNKYDSNGLTPLHYAMRDGIKVVHGYPIVDETQVCGFGGEDHLCKPLATLTELDQALLNDPTSYLFLEDIKYDPNELLPGRNMHNLASVLLDKGADPNAPMKFPPSMFRFEHSWYSLEGATPFFLAAASHDTTAIAMLMEANPDPKVTTRVDPEEFSYGKDKYADDNQVIGNASLLMAAVGAGRKIRMSHKEEENALEIAKKLINMGAAVNEATETGWTALHVAAFLGSAKLVRLLVQEGAEIDVTNGCGQSPISMTIGGQEGLPDRAVPEIEVAELLLELGAGTKPPSAPVGTCVLGRGGLEADESQKALVQHRVQAIQEKLDERKLQYLKSQRS